MLPAISQVCSLHSTFERDVEDYAAGKCPAIEIWLTKLENFLDHHSIDDVIRLLHQNEIVAPVASYQGGLLDSQGEKRRAAWDLFESRLELCRQIGVSTIVVAADLHPPLSQQQLDRTTTSLNEVAIAAGKRGLRAALEFQSHSPFLNNLQTAAAVIADVASPHLGLCLDAFHFEVGPSKLSDLQYLTNSNTFHVQLSDLADVARELASDADRILPGDGDIPLTKILERLMQIQYEHVVSVELMNPQLWHVPALEFGEVATTAIRCLLGQNESAK